MRITQKTNDKIDKIVKNFNQKIARLEKLDNELYLPEKIKKKDLTNITNRQDLIKKMNELQRFSRRGIEQTVELDSGLKLSRYEKNEVSIKIRTAKTKLTMKIRRLETIKPKVAGKEQDVTFAQMGDSQYMNLKAQRERLNKQKVQTMTREDIDKYKSIALKILKKGYSSVFRESYKTMVKDIGYQINYDQDKINSILDKIDTVTDSNFLKLFNEDKAIKSVIYYYGGSGEKIEDFSEDIKLLFDEIYTNINTIIEDYK